MKKYIAFSLFLFVLAGMAATHMVAQDNKVPPDIGIRIRNVQHDQDKLNAQVVQLQLQYQGIQQSLAHDTTELESIKKEALAAAKKDDTWDVDVDKLEFMAKPKPAATATK